MLSFSEIGPENPESAQDWKCLVSPTHFYLSAQKRDKWSQPYPAQRRNKQQSHNTNIYSSAQQAVVLGEEGGGLNTLFPRSLPFCEHFICLFFFYNMIIFCLFFVVAPWFFLIHRLIWLPYIVSINIMTYLTVKFSVQYAVPSYVSSTYLFPYFSKIAIVYL